MQKLQFDYYQHPNLDYSEFAKSEYFNKIGFHKLKDTFGAYLRLGGTCQSYIGPQDCGMLDSKLFLVETDTKSSKKEQQAGISEDTLLAALAIAQNPELAPQLLALRHTT